MKPMISVAATTGLLEALTAAGGNAEQISAQVGLDASLFADPEEFIPCATFARLLEEAARATGDDCFGLHFGEQFNPKNIGPLTYAVLNAPTVGVADEQVTRYLKLYNQVAQVSSTVAGPRAYMKYVLCDMGIPSLRQENEYSMVIRLNTIRMMVGSQWGPIEVQFAHEKPQDISEHERIFCAPALFGYSTNNFLVDAELLDCKVPAADPALYRIVKRYLDEILEAMPPEDDLITAVRRAIAEVLREGEPSLTRIAKKMGVGPRTLQRQLKERQIKCRKLVDDTRKHFALSYLKDPKNTLTQIAFLLGYSEASAFNRAFRRWTGSTPLAYRYQTAKTAPAMPVD